jgi:hypothetical protein
MQRNKDTKLWVKATGKHSITYVDSPRGSGQSPNFVGIDWVDEKVGYQVIPEGVKVSYNPHYIHCIKEGSLLAVDLMTAQLAGVLWDDPLELSGPKPTKEVEFVFFAKPLDSEKLSQNALQFLPSTKHKEI